MDSIDSVVESEPNSSTDTSLDQNEDDVDEQQNEKAFIGFGEDSHLEKNYLQSTATKLKKPNTDINEYEAPAEVKYLSKLAHKLVMETYSPFKPSDFEDPESIVHALNLLLSIRRDDRLREYIENSSHFIGFADSFNDLNQSQSYKNVSSPRESVESSLGVFSFSELSSFSSNEALKIDNIDERSPNAKNSFDFLSEIEDLQHQNKRLNEEKSHLMLQISQTEDMNTNLFYENQELQKKYETWQIWHEKWKDTEKDNARLKLTLSNYEEANHMLQERLTNFNKERMSLDARIRDLNEELTLVNQEVDTLRSTVDDLKETLALVNIENNLLNKANEILNQDLQEKTELVEKRTQALAEMAESSECLRAQKSELELLYCRAEEEVAALHYATQNLEIIEERDSETNAAFSCSCSHDLSMSSSNCANCTEISKVNIKLILPKGSFAISPIRKDLNGLKASTPTKRKAIPVTKPSLCAEMKDSVRSKGTPLPSPFCGKHILPAALYSDTKTGLFDDNSQTRRGLESFDETDSAISASKNPKLLQYFDPDSLEISSSVDLNKSFESVGNKANRAINYFRDVKPEKLFTESLTFLEQVLNQLEEINTSLISITTESTPTYQPYPDANGIINEPPPASHAGGVDESLKERINGELKVLRSQIRKTQAIVSYLSRGQKLPAGIASLNSFIIEKDGEQRAKSELAGSFERLSGDLLTSSETGHHKSFWSREHVRHPSYSPSQRSTPLHKARWLTKSCPNLPSHWSVINRSTQTENSRMASEELSRTPVSELGTKLSLTPLKTTPTAESPGSCDVASPPTNREDDLAITVSPLALRNRSLSYVTAIKKGNFDDSPSPSLAPEDVVIVHDQTPDLRSPLEFPEDDNKNLKDTSSLDDEIDARFQEQQRGRLSSSKSENGDAQISSEPSPPQLPLEKAKKRRRSFSEHNSSYSGTIDLDEREPDFVDAEQMQGPFVTTAGQVLSGSTSPVLTMDKLPAALPVSLSPPSVDVSVVKFPKASAAYTARAALSDKPKRLGRNPRFLMPDVMETSETESAKDSANGSMESETTEPVTTTTTVLSTASASVTITTVATAAPVTEPTGVEVLQPPPPGVEPCFPSLPDDFLRKLNLEKGSLLNTEEMTSQEVESKFGTLSLAFKTDKFTLSKRLELQKRQRDMAEGNIDKEVAAMKEALNALNHMCTDSQMRELIVKVQHHIDIVHQSTSRMSSRAEVYGAVQQEFRARLYSAVTPLSSSLSPAKLEKLNAVSVASSTSSPPAVAPAQLSLTNNQRFPFPSPSSSPAAGQGGPLRKLTIGSTATGPLNSLTGNEELLAALERVESNSEDKTASETEVAVSSQESNNNELRNEVDPKDDSNCSTLTNYSQTDSPKPITHRSVIRDDRRNTPDSDRSQTPTPASSHPYGRQLSRILFRRDPIRPNNSWLASWAPDDGWWSRWDFRTISRNFRYGLGITLLLGALFSIIFTFLPNESTACNSSASYTSRSVQEFFQYYVNMRKNNPTV